MLPVKGIGNFGTHEAVYFFGLQLFGVSEGRSSALSLATHSLDFVLVGISATVGIGMLLVMKEKAPAPSKPAKRANNRLVGAARFKRKGPLRGIQHRMKDKSKTVITVIEPGSSTSSFFRSQFDAVRDVYLARFLIWRMFRRDFAAQFRQKAPGLCLGLSGPVHGGGQLFDHVLRRGVDPG